MSEYLQMALPIFLEQGYLPPRLDLTPADLVSAGWLVHPHRIGGWVARQENAVGGCIYTPPFLELETLIRFVRINRIAKEPWTESF